MNMQCFSFTLNNMICMKTTRSQFLIHIFVFRHFSSNINIRKNDYKVKMKHHLCFPPHVQFFNSSVLFSHKLLVNFNANCMGFTNKTNVRRLNVRIRIVLQYTKHAK